MVIGGRDVPGAISTAKGRFGAILTFPVLVCLAAFTTDECRRQCHERGEEDKKLWAELHDWLALGLGIATSSGLSRAFI